MPLRLYNTLTKRVEAFTPADPARITFYSCGPTVYDDAHIGNFRSFLAADVLRRWLESPLCELANETPAQKAHREKHGRRVVHVMNITDVGHMTDDAEGGEAGEDRMAVAGRRIAEAKKAGKLPPGVEVNPNDPYQIARFYEHRFKEDAEKLGLKVVIDAGGSAAPDDDPRRVMLTPRATENVAGMITVIARLIERGCAYVSGAPGSRVVYFDVQKFPPYGRLSGNTLDRLRTGAGGRISDANQSQKHHPADFLLWKEDPRHIMKWPSPWGEGYPGWHIECTAMSVSRLLDASAFRADTDPSRALIERLAVSGRREPLIDLHSGGEDNIFPHHECEIAQSCCAFNDPGAVSPETGLFARTWFHPRFLLVEGDKMSKSKGNFDTPRDLFAKGIEPAAIRLELIRTHYRSNANFTMQGLSDAQRMLDRWRRARTEIARRAMGWTSMDTRAVVANGEMLLRLHLQNDLNVAGAIGWINERIDTLLAAPVDAAKVPRWNDDETNQYIRERSTFGDVTHQPIDIFEHLDAVLGVLSLERPAATRTSLGVFAPGVDPSAVVETKLVERRDARAAKDFKKSDAIRDELAAMGYAIKDLPGGKVEVRRA